MVIAALDHALDHAIDHALDGPAIVSWFALLVVMFVVFVGLGIYQNRRSQTPSRDEVQRAAAASARHLRKKPAHTRPSKESP